MKRLNLIDLLCILLLKEQQDLEPSPIRKKNSKRKDQCFVDSWGKLTRRVIETTESVLNSMLLQKIYAVTFGGFIRKLKVALLGIISNPVKLWLYHTEHTE
jgi:hypothetical protein